MPFIKLSQFLQAAVKIPRIHSARIRADNYKMIGSAEDARCCDHTEITIIRAFLPFGMATATEET
jgi:hypothetical protein